MKNILSHLRHVFVALSLMSLAACIEIAEPESPDSNVTDDWAELILLFPENGQTDVPVGIDAVRLTINNINGDLVTSSNISFTPALSGVVTLISESEIQFQPTDPLDAYTTYTMTVSGLKTLSGNSVAPVSWSFTTNSTPVVLSDCTLSTVLCVDDTAGENQEYSSIQAAIDVSQAGDTVLVFSGNYDGFRVDKSGTSSQRIKIMSAAADVYITGSEPYGNNAIRVDNASYITVEGFNITRTSISSGGSYNDSCVAARGANVSVPMQSLSFINNHLDGCSPAGMYLSNVNNLLIKRNTVVNTSRNSSGSQGMGFYIANSAAKNATIIENKIMNNSGDGMHFNGDSSVGGDGVQSGHLIKDNFIIGNGINGFNMDGIVDTEVVNNVFAENGRHGMRGFMIDGGSGPQNFKIVNNTFYSNGSSAVKMTADSGGHVVFNNIVIDNVENNFVIDAANMTASNNLISTDEVSIFVSAVDNDFRLKSSAAAVNGGTASLLTTNSPLYDISATIRSVTPDIGAFELGSEYPAWY
jgi:Bacterial Ig-like domain/Right handed beta helix region